MAKKAKKKAKKKVHLRTVAETTAKPKFAKASKAGALEKGFDLLTSQRLVALIEQRNSDVAKIADLTGSIKAYKNEIADCEERSGSRYNALCGHLVTAQQERDKCKHSKTQAYEDAGRLIMEAAGGELLTFDEEAPKGDSDNSNQLKLGDDGEDIPL